MRSIILLLIFAMIGCKQPKKGIDIECVLTEPQIQTVGCGVLSVWVGMKFKVLKRDEHFIGLIHCPDVYDSDFFQKGKQYSIKASDSIPDSTQHLILNSYQKEKVPVKKVEEIEAIGFK